jgi:hypothetical protein
MTGAEASGQYNFTVKVLFFNFFSKQRDDFLRAFQVAGRAYTNLNDYHFLHLSLYLVFKKFFGGIRRYGMKLTVNLDADTLLALAHAESSAKLYLVTETILGNKLLKLLNNLM